MTNQIALDVNTFVDAVRFLKLSFGAFGNTRKAHCDVQSEGNPARYKHQKTLLESEELKAITKSDTEFRTRIDLFCLPYDMGIRLLPTASAAKVEQLCKEYASTTRPALLQKFYDVYEAQVAEAKTALKGDFNPLDYPPKDYLPKIFTFEYALITFNFVGDNASDMVKNAAQGVIEALCTTAHELVAHLLDRLSADADGKPKRLHATAVSHLTEFLQNFSALNVVNHAGLKVEMDKIQALLDGVDADKIKNSDNLRLNLQSKLSESLQSLGTIAEVKGRKFRDAPKAELPELDVTDSLQSIGQVLSEAGLAAA